MTQAAAPARPLLVPLGWCVVAALLFGAAAPLTKPLLEAGDPFVLAGLLYLGGAVGVLPLLRRNDLARRRPSARSLALAAGATLAGGIVAPVLLLLALRASEAARVSLWLGFEPVATAVIARLAFREALHARIWLALGLVGGGSALLAGGAGGGAVPAALAIGACALWGLDNNLVARIDDLSPAVVTLAKASVAGVTNAAIGTLAFSAPLAGESSLLALLIGAPCYGLSICLFVAGAQQAGAVRAQLAFATAPFLGAVLSWLLLGESPGPATLAAGVLMAAGVALAATARHEHEHEHDPVVHAHLHRHDDGHHEHEHAPGEAPARPGAWHAHEHAHAAVRHAHAHVTDVHHAHRHG